MEYPFKDLMPLDEVLEREGYYKDWTHLDPEVFYSLTQISKYIKTKGYGVDVRLLIAQLAEHFGLKTTQVVDLGNLLQQKFTNLEGVTQSFTNNINSLVAQMEAEKDAVIANATVDSEVILARGGKATLQARLDDSDAQLAQTEHRLADNPVKPEDFTGTDYEKLQQAFDKAIMEYRPLQISKEYNIGSNTITINKGADSRKPLMIFGGGKIKKDVEGFMFKGLNKSVSDIFFEGIWFQGVKDVPVSVFDTGDANLIRINTNMCYFDTVHTIFYASTYLQDIKMNKDTIVNCSGAVFDMNGTYGVIVDAVTMEKSKGRMALQRNLTSDNNVLTSFIVSNSIIEGFFGVTHPIFDFRSGNVQLINNYFEEAPGGVVRFSGYGKIIAHRNVLLGNNNGNAVFAYLGNSSNSLFEFKHNTVPEFPIVDASDLIGTSKVIMAGNTSNVPSIDPNNKITDVYRDVAGQDITKLGNNFTRVVLNKEVSGLEKENLLYIELLPNTASYISVKGSGVASTGIFGINKTFKLRRTTSNLYIEDGIVEDWGFPTGYSENIFLEKHNTYFFMLKGNSKTELPVKYDLTIEIYGKNVKVNML